MTEQAGQITAKVENVELKNGRFGDYRVIYLDNGWLMNYGGQSEIAIGGSYTFGWSLSKSGYKKIDRIISEGAGSVPQGSSQAKQAPATPRPSREQSIEMQVCLKCAAELVSNLRSSGEYKPSEISADVTAIAKDFYLNIFTVPDGPDF